MTIIEMRDKRTKLLATMDGFLDIVRVPPSLPMTRPSVISY